MTLTQYILQHTQLPLKSIENTVALLDEDCTIPFISRYRKERTGNLDEVQIGAIVAFKAQFEALQKRKIAILKALDEQQVLTTELRQKLIRPQILLRSKTFTYPTRKKERQRPKRPLKTDWSLWRKSSWGNARTISVL